MKEALHELHDLKRLVMELVGADAGNTVAPAVALRPELAGMKIFDDPLFAVGAATDPLFADLKKEEAVGPHHRVPSDWLPDAASVLSVFFPYTDQIKKANAALPGRPADEWLHGRVEGQMFINRVAAAAQARLTAGGAGAVAPCLDKRLVVKEGVQDEDGRWLFTSNWSERHVAYICGHGTFGLSKGLITAKGIAGRLTSIVTDLLLPVTPRSYTGLYENCIMCGACAPPCPGDAITLAGGKDHLACDRIMKGTRITFTPRYGCGKCQVGVPCESRIPGRRS